MLLAKAYANVLCICLTYTCLNSSFLPKASYNNFNSLRRISDDSKALYTFFISYSFKYPLYYNDSIFSIKISLHVLFFKAFSILKFANFFAYLSKSLVSYGILYFMSHTHKSFGINNSFSFFLFISSELFSKSIFFLCYELFYVILSL